MTERTVRCFYATVALVAGLFWATSFEIVGRYAATLPTLDLTSRWDRAIPLVPAFIWPYELCYFLPALALVIIRDFHRFDQALLAIFLASLAAYVMYVLVPVAFPRPVLGDSISERILALEYAADFTPGANNLPSLHVALSFIMGRAMLGQRARWVDALVATVVLFITASTLLVKQHLLIDVGVGLLWGPAAFWLAERLYARFVDPLLPPERALRSHFTRP